MDEILRIDGVCLGLVAVKADNGEFLFKIAYQNVLRVYMISSTGVYRLNLTRVNLNHSDAGRNELFPQ